MTQTPMGVLLSDLAAKRGQETCLIYPDQVLSWGELERRSNQRAYWLRSLGVTRDDFVTIALPNSPEFHEIVFATWKLGATPHIAPVNSSERELARLLALAQPRFGIGDGRPSHRSLGLRPANVELSSFLEDPLPPAIAKHWRALSTGGSTGSPKLIVDSMPSMFDPQAYRSGPFPFDACVLNPGPLHHSVPFFATHFGLLSGNCVVGMTRFDAQNTLELIDRHAVTYVLLSPTMMHRIWRLGPERRALYTLSSLQFLMHVGAPTPHWLKEAFIDWLGPERIFEIYGSTESVGETMISGVEWLQKKGSVGRPMPGVRMRVIREDGHDCAPGEVGEIYAIPKAGPGSRYHYIGAEPKRIEGGWETLGDLGWLDEDGYLFIADRRIDLILSGGVNIYPAEVESALLEHPGVSSAIVIGLPDGDLGQKVHAVVEPNSDVTVTADILDTFLADRLAKYKRPRSYEFTDKTLRDDAGKVRRALWRDAWAGNSDHA